MRWTDHVSDDGVTSIDRLGRRTEWPDGVHVTIGEFRLELHR